MPRKVANPEPLPTGDRICCFCGLKDDNELEYGKLHVYDGIVTHYYCLLLSSNMQQRGRDDEGILGFLTEDINKELRRGKRLACCYCKKSGATLGCCNLKCKRIFHFPCGLKSGSLHQFFGEFKSYCKAHRPTQKIDARVSEELKHRDTMICYICYDEVNPHDMFSTLWAPCCKKNAWFHRPCVQQLAMSAGYFFKCPLCNNKTDFQKAMLDHGIFIPSQDASWELVPNAFEELLYRHNRCDAHKCLCPKGREHVSTNAKWELTLCRTCGSQGIHMACGNLKWVKPIWECNECISILNKSVTSGNGETMSIGRGRRDERSPRRDVDSLTDDEDSDSDISVGGVPDSRLPIATNSASSADDSPVKSSRTVAPRSNHVDSSAARWSRRSGPLARSTSPTKNFPTSQESAKGPCNDDELPPVPKKPRIADTAIRAEQSPVIDSDDDIIVISGPSRGERVVPMNGAKSPSNNVHRGCNDARSIERNDKADVESHALVRQLNMRKVEKIGTTSKLPSDAPTKTEARVIKPPSSETLRPPPVEIDLSGGEITVPESASISETNHPTPTFGDGPELNIKITNVTSLAPGAFDLVPETRNQQTVVTSNYVPTNGDADSEEPVILNEKLVPKERRNNNALHDSMHEQMKIVKLDGSDGVVAKQGNSVIYGLTIPGTNHTVPFIIAPPENCKSKTPGIHPDPNNPLGIALCDCNSSRKSSITDILNLNVFNGTTKGCVTIAASKPAPSLSVTQTIDNSQVSNPVVHTAKRGVEKPSAPQSIDAKIWSVPLRSIVTGPIGKAHSSAKADGIHDNYFSLTKTNGSPVASPQTPQDNATSTSTIFRTIAPRGTASIEETKSSNETATTRFVHFPSKSSSSPQNGSVSSASKSSRRTKSKPVKNVSTVSNPSTVWAKVNGSYVPIDPATAKDLIEAAKPASSKGPSEKSSIPNSESPMFQFVATDAKDKNNSSNNCDGDAGSAPAVQPAVNPTNARTDSPRSPATSGADASCDVLERRYSDGKSEWRCGNQKDDTPERSPTSDGSDACDRTGLINKTINLRDIKFTIDGPNIVKMTLYETYNVNIKIDTTSRCEYEKSKDEHDSGAPILETTRRSSTAETEKIPKINYRDSANTAVSLTNERSHGTIARPEEASLSRPSENNVDIPESTSAEIQSHADSRGQDELKENRDPIPASSNSANATSAAERKSKTRSRSGVNDNSMRSLNDKGAQEAITEKNDAISNKAIANETAHRVANSPKMYYNGFKDAHEARSIVATIETDVSHSAVARNPVNSIGNAEVTKKRRIFVDDGNTSAKSTIVNNSTNYDCAKTIDDPPIVGASVAKITERFDPSRRRKVDIEKNYDERQSRVKLKIGHETNNLRHTETQRTNGNGSIVENAQPSDTSKRRRSSINDGHSNKAEQFSKLVASNHSKNRHFTMTDSPVNGVKNSKRRFSETNHVCRSKKIHSNRASHNGETSSSGEPPRCKVSIDLARVREVLAEKLNGEAKIREMKNERFANGMHGARVFESKFFVENKIFLSRSRSFDGSREIDTSRKNETSVVELRRSKSHENLVSFSVRYRCANGAMGIEVNRRSISKRQTRGFEKHDCVR